MPTKALRNGPMPSKMRVDLKAAARDAPPPHRVRWRSVGHDLEVGDLRRLFQKSLDDLANPFRCPAKSRNQHVKQRIVLAGAGRDIANHETCFRFYLHYPSALVNERSRDTESVRAHGGSEPGREFRALCKDSG